MEQMAGDPIQETGCGMHAVQLVRIGTNRLQISCICVNQPAREQIFGRTYKSVGLLCRKRECCSWLLVLLMTIMHFYYTLHPGSWTYLFPYISPSSCVSSGTQSLPNNFALSTISNG